MDNSMEVKFKLLSQTEKALAYLNRLLPNYPKKAANLKRHIEECQYDMMENIFAYNLQKTDRIKEKYLYDYLVKLSMYDYYARESYHKKYINSHQLDCLTNIIIEARKITYGLIKTNNAAEDQPLQ